MVSLYTNGWRQGTILTARLPLMGVSVDTQGDIIPNIQYHGAWVIATQDCDLDRFDELVSDDVVELCPVFHQDPPTSRGIRSRKCRLVDALYVEAQSRRTMVPPEVLALLLREGKATRNDGLANNPALKTAFKTWLGLRYDRPAVQPEFVDLAKRIADEIEQHASTTSDAVRDVLVQFESGNPPIYALHAIILNTSDTSEVTTWLTEATLRVPANLGILGELKVGTDAETSLKLLEGSFSVDLTQITWGGRSLRGSPGRFSHPHGLNE